MANRTAVLLLLLIGLFAVPITQAQDTDQSGFTIHVVQRDETLFQIAQQYGATLDSIITVNSILDPDKLQVGQRLIIPNERGETPGLVETHIVEPGETLHTIAERFNSTLESLSKTNNIFSANSLYIGQAILVTRGANGVLPSDPSSLHIVASGDTIWRLSLQYQIPVSDLLRVNQLEEQNPLQVGQHIIILGSSQAGRFVNLPAPITDFQVSPLPAEQGRSIGVMMTVSNGTTILGKIFDREVRFAQYHERYYAMIGVHSFTEPGIYPFTITITDAAGAQTIYQTRIQVQDGGYDRENIDIPTERQDLLDPAVVQGELDRVSNLMSAYTEQKFLNGLMNLPSTGPVTSQYGTRRSYNGSDYDTFHGGADFGGAEGSVVLAPADGVVVLAEPLQVRGNAIIIDHGWGVYTGYWHNTEIYVQPNQFVQRGEPISTLGATGLVTGAHLHWEMWVGGVQVDPLQWVVHAFDDFSLEDPAESIAFN